MEKKKNIIKHPEQYLEETVFLLQNINKTIKNSVIKTKMVGSALLGKLEKNSRQLQSENAMGDGFFFLQKSVKYKIKRERTKTKV